MKVNFREWLKTQPQDLQQEIGTDIKKYQKKRINLEGLKAIDNKYILKVNNG